MHHYGVVIVAVQWNFIFQDSGKDIITVTAVTYFYVWPKMACKYSVMVMIVM